MFGQNGGGMTFESFWRQLTVTFKCLAILSLSLAVLGIFTPFVGVALANTAYHTVNKLQIWRLFTSFLVDSSIINVIFNLYILSSILPDLEKKYSTAYAVFEVLIQNFICNIVFILFAEILGFLGLISIKTFGSYGLANLMLILMWQRVAMNPDEMTRFCCLPCLMPAKYLPWCFMAILLLQGVNGAFIGCLLGYYQYIFSKRPLLSIPLRWYLKAESWLPNRIKKDEGFVPIALVESSLRSIASHSAYSQANAAADNNQLMSDAVVGVGGGVAIGGSLQETADYRLHWIQQEDRQQIVGQDRQNAAFEKSSLNEAGKEEDSTNTDSHQTSSKHLNTNLI